VPHECIRRQIGISQNSKFIDRREHHVTLDCSFPDRGLVNNDDASDE
jgi:hypothetical protein